MKKTEIEIMASIIAAAFLSYGIIFIVTRVQ